MLGEKTYTNAAIDFGVSVGVAHIIEREIKELKNRDEVVRYSDESYINNVIKRCIEMGKYKLLQRTIYRLRKKAGKRNIKEVSIYRKSWYFITNGYDKRNKPKSGKVLEESR
jgi:hypothetical protein